MSTPQRKPRAFPPGTPANPLPQEQRSDPLTGISSDYYTGKGQVQSPPKN